MAKLCFLLVIFSLAVNSGYSQTNVGTVKGSATGENKSPVGAVTIALLKPADSGMVKMIVSAPDGSFAFDQVREGAYMVSATAVGYKKVFSASFEVKAAGEMELPPLTLQVQSKQLKEVIVTAARPLIEQKLDKTVVNVEASITNTGSSALEVLEKSPGVMVSGDGNISLRGKQGVTILIDGKQTYLSAADLASLLKNMPASELDQIEIMTNPSARYDATGNAGVINLKTKKGKANGLNGNIMVGATAGIYQLGKTVYLLPKSQNSINFNLRKNKLNFFGSYNPNYYQGRHTMYFDRKFSDKGVLKGSSDQESRIRFANMNHSLKLGLDWYAGKKDVFGTVLSGFLYNGNETPTTLSHTANAGGARESTLASHADNRTSNRNFTWDINWKHTFDSAGNELATDFDLVRFSKSTGQLLTTDVFNAISEHTNQLLLRGNLPSDIYIYTLKSDYAFPFKKGKMEAGVKSSYVKNVNVAEYARLVTDKWMEDDRSNEFVFEENINAAYVNLQQQLKKWTFQAGLRYENTNAKGLQVTSGTSFTRNLHSLFPSAFTSYALNKNNSLTVSYSRRINRPNYKDLNPFIYFLDSLTYAIGNPNLKPQYTHKAELSHAFKSKYITTFSFSNTTDVIAQILRQKPDERITYVSRENVAAYRNISLSLTAPLKITTWWNANLYGNVYNNRYQGIYENSPIDEAYTSFMLNITNSFKLGKGYSAEVSGFYQHKGYNQLTHMLPMYQMSAGVQKKVLGEKGTLRLNVRDPFAWQRFSGITQYGDLYFHERNRPDTRQVSASFSYRFGKNAQPGQTPSRRNAGSQDEQNRVGN